MKKWVVILGICVIVGGVSLTLWLLLGESKEEELEKTKIKTISHESSELSFSRTDEEIDDAVINDEGTK